MNLRRVIVTVAALAVFALCPAPSGGVWPPRGGLTWTTPLVGRVPTPPPPTPCIPQATRPARARTARAVRPVAAPVSPSTSA